MVLRGVPIGYNVNPRKISQEDTVTDAEKGSQHKTFQPFLNKNITKVIPMKIMFLLMIHGLTMVIV